MRPRTSGGGGVPRGPRAALALAGLIALAASAPACSSKARAVRARAASDLGCRAADVEVTSLGGSSYQATGCGSTATYVCLREAPPAWAYGSNGAVMWAGDTVCLREGGAPAAAAAAEPACPPGTQWNGSVCLARVVVACPPGSRFEPGTGCVADAISRDAAAGGGRPPGCPQGMALIPGDATAGAGRSALCVDVTEVTVASYDACVLRRSCSSDGLSCGNAATYPGGGHGQHPLNCVSWGQAALYCREQGKRLPTSREWEWAARGGGAAPPDGAASPPPAEAACWSGASRRAGTCAARENAGDATAQRVLGLATNVSEWTSSGQDRERETRGGHFASVRGDALLESATADAGSRSERVGFRCVAAAVP